MQKFILLIVDEDQDTWSQMSPAEQQAGVEKYMAWSQKLKAEGRLVDAEGLDPKIVSLAPGGIVQDGPFAETKEMVGGYYIFTAADWDEAIAIAKGCPTFDHGGKVQLRTQMSY